MKPYKILFPAILETQPEDVQEDEETNQVTHFGECIPFEQYERFFREGVSLRFIESYPDRADVDNVASYLFEVNIDFKAKDDEEAIKKSADVLKDHDCEWVVFVILLNNRVVYDSTL